MEDEQERGFPSGCGFSIFTRFFYKSWCRDRITIYRYKSQAHSGTAFNTVLLLILLLRCWNRLSDAWNFLSMGKIFRPRSRRCERRLAGIRRIWAGASTFDHFVMTWECGPLRIFDYAQQSTPCLVRSKLNYLRILKNNPLFTTPATIRTVIKSLGTNAGWHGPRQQLAARNRWKCNSKVPLVPGKWKMECLPLEDA